VELLNGFDFLIAVIGLFGIGEILLTMEEGLSLKGRAAGINPKVVLQTWAELPRYRITSLRSCVIGCWMGLSPAGATPASFMSYGIAKRTSRRGDKSGNGEIEGVIAPETAAHAAGTSALLPMLSLGVPGSPTAAVLLGGLLIWGLQPGPLLFIEQKEFVWGLIASMYLGNLAGLVVVLTCVPLFAAILRIPFGTQLPGHGNGAPAGIKMGTGISVDTRSPNWRQTHDQRYSCQPVLRDIARWRFQLRLIGCGNIRRTHRGDRLCLPGNGQWRWLAG
jgi:TctA family transporter